MWWTVPPACSPRGWSPAATSMTAPAPPSAIANRARSPSSLLNVMPSIPASMPAVGSGARSDMVTECRPRTACSAGTLASLSQPERASPGEAIRSITIPTGSRKVSTSSPSRARGPSCSIPSAATRCAHQPNDSGGTLNAVDVVSPDPCLPGGTSGHGKNVRMLDGLPCSSP